MDRQVASKTSMSRQSKMKTKLKMARNLTMRFNWQKKFSSSRSRDRDHLETVTRLTLAICRTSKLRAKESTLKGRTFQSMLQKWFRILKSLEEVTTKSTYKRFKPCWTTSRCQMPLLPRTICKLESTQLVTWRSARLPHPSKTCSIISRVNSVDNSSTPGRHQDQRKVFRIRFTSLVPSWTDQPT